VRILFSGLRPVCRTGEPACGRAPVRRLARQSPEVVPVGPLLRPAGGAAGPWLPATPSAVLRRWRRMAGPSRRVTAGGADDAGRGPAI